MNRKPIVLDLSYYYSESLDDYKQLIKKFESGSGHHKFLAKEVELHVIRLLNQKNEVEIDEIKYHFLKGSKSTFWIPFRLHARIKKLNPDVILLHGFENFIQILLLAMQTEAKLVIQYHGGGIPVGGRRLAMQLIKYVVTNYIFTAREQAKNFVDKKIILPKSTIFQIMEGSTNKVRIPKLKARKSLQINQNEKIYLWVGRLNENKDPLTILTGIEKVFKKNDKGILYMIYDDNHLLKKVKKLISESEILTKRVRLIGKLPHDELDEYYCSADYFILGSHFEAGGYSLCEALACGCAPIVTDIPSFRMMTNKGKLGALWAPGSVIDFISAVANVERKNIEEESMACENYFQEALSFQAIAKGHREMINIILKLN